MQLTGWTIGELARRVRADGGCLVVAWQPIAGVPNGARTPTEAQAAYEAGADFVKLFPADKLGPAYVKALRAPLPHLKLVPTGGVDLNTAGDFLRAGCAALGVGGALLTPEILRTEDWPALSRLAAEFVRIVRDARGAVR